jgi:hypothetical protein
VNYKKHYDALMKRAVGRERRGVMELHHVVPRCLGGTDEHGNLVLLTPEEHYVAHQLLCQKISDGRRRFLLTKDGLRRAERALWWQQRACSDTASH